MICKNIKWHQLLWDIIWNIYWISFCTQFTTISYIARWLLLTIVTAMLTMLSNCILISVLIHTQDSFHQASLLLLFATTGASICILVLQSIHQESLHLTFTIPSPKRTLLSFIIQTHYLIDFIPMLFIRSIFLETLLTLFERFY